MNTNRLFNAVILQLLTILCLQSHSDIKTGMIEFSHPTSKPFYVDFSDQITYKANMKADSVSADSADLIFTNMSIDAPYGIQKVTLSDFYQKYINGKIVSNSSDILPYLDTVAKEFKLSKASLTIPDTIQNKATIGTDTAMLAKTREGGVVLLLRAYMYIGGLDRYFLYWVYQSSGDATFYKNELIPPVDSLTLTLNIFSGRPDPVFTIKNNQCATELITRISYSFNKLLNPSAQIQAWDTISAFGSIPGVWIQKIGSGSEYPAYHLINDKAFFHQVPQEISSSTPPAIQNSNYELLRFIIKNGILNNIETRDMYGVIRFRDLFPENILTEIDTCSAERFRQLLSRQTNIQHTSIPQLQQKSLCKATLTKSALKLETESGVLSCAIVGLDGTVVDQFSINTLGTCRLPFSRTTCGVFFVTGTITLANGVINKLSLRVVR